MLREVTRIEFQFCPGEAAALKHESRLIRSLKPKFNRAGVWPGKTTFIVWRFENEHLELGVAEVPEPGWRRFGPLGGGSRYLHQSLARLLWLALNPGRACTELPAGWARGDLAQQVKIDCRESAQEVGAELEKFFWQSPDVFPLWLGAKFAGRTHPFERTVIESELEILQEFSEKQRQLARRGPQLALL
jgi:hypothetical protein